MISGAERGPGPVTIERVMGAWRRAREGLAEDELLAEDERAVNLDLKQTDADAETILRRLVSAMTFAALREAEAAELSAAMDARASRYKRRGEMLRREILDIMLILDRERVVAPEGTVSLRALPNSVVITDEAALPAEYIRETITRVPDKTALKADLIEGVVIPGAELSNGGIGLSFRRARI